MASFTRQFEQLVHHHYTNDVLPIIAFEVCHTVTTSCVLMALSLRHRSRLPEYPSCVLITILAYCITKATKQIGTEKSMIDIETAVYIMRLVIIN